MLASDTVQNDGFMLQIAQKIINHYLSLDTEISQKFGEMDGKCIKIQLTSPEMTIFCFPGESRLDLIAHTDHTPDCSIKGSLIELIKLTKNHNPTSAISSGAIIIEGDSRLAQRFSDIFSAVDADWEEMMSQYTGDFIASRFGNSLRQGKQLLERGLSLLQNDTSDYLQEESKMLPTRVEIESYKADVDQCRDDVERLDVKITRLARTIKDKQ